MFKVSVPAVLYTIQNNLLYIQQKKREREERVNETQVYIYL